MLKLVPKDVARKHMVLPVNRAGATLIVAMSDPSNIYAIDELKFLTQYNIEPVVASEGAIDEAIQRYYEQAPDLSELVGEFEAEDIDFSADAEEDLNIVDIEKQSHIGELRCGLVAYRFICFFPRSNVVGATAILLMLGLT